MGPPNSLDTKICCESNTGAVFLILQNTFLCILKLCCSLLNCILYGQQDSDTHCKLCTEWHEPVIRSTLYQVAPTSSQIGTVKFVRNRRRTVESVISTSCASLEFMPRASRICKLFPVKSTSKLLSHCATSQKIVPRHESKVERRHKVKLCDVTKVCISVTINCLKVGLASTLDLEHQRPNSKSRSPLHHNWTEFK